MQLVDQIRTTLSYDHIVPCNILLRALCRSGAAEMHHDETTDTWSQEDHLNEECSTSWGKTVLMGRYSRCIKEMKGKDLLSKSPVPDVLHDSCRWVMHKTPFNSIMWINFGLINDCKKSVHFPLWELHSLEHEESVWRLYQIKNRAAAVNEGPPSLALNMMPIYQRPLTLPATWSGHRKYRIPGRWELKLKLQKPSLCKWLGAAVLLHISEHLNSAICHILTGLHEQRVKKGIMPWLDSRCGVKEMSPFREKHWKNWKNKTNWEARGWNLLEDTRKSIGNKPIFQDKRD